MKPTTHHIRRACLLWNWHTSPTALRSDREHERHHRAARKIAAWLHRNACEGLQWHENEVTGKRSD
jgi:hypothetical protein